MSNSLRYRGTIDDERVAQIDLVAGKHRHERFGDIPRARPRRGEQRELAVVDRRVGEDRRIAEEAAVGDPRSR
jgi:hypothetical protein